MADSGKRLTRQPGAFWVLAGTYYAYGDAAVRARAIGLVPSDWHTSTQTMQALERRGWVRRAGIHAEAWLDERELTEEGRKAIHAVKG